MMGFYSCKRKADSPVYFLSPVEGVRVVPENTITLKTDAAQGKFEDFVTELKQSLLQKAAEEYLYIMNFKGEIRFDIISILFKKNGEHTLKHIEDAFW